VTARAIACALVAAAACHPAPAPSTPMVASPPVAQPPPAVAAQPADMSVAPSAAPARDLEAELGEHSRTVYACIEHALADKPLLQGHLSADVDVDRDGRVVDVEIPESTFPADGALRACVVDAWRAVRIAPLAARTTVRSELTWEATSRCDDAARSGPRGTMDRETIRRIIRSHLGEVRACYEQQLMHRPTEQGRVTVQFTISGSGHVVASTTPSSTIDDPAVGDCISAAVRRWRFPRPCGGGIVIVSYPFVLKVAGAP
jgi:hypothetical protein